MQVKLLDSPNKKITEKIILRTFRLLNTLSGLAQRNMVYMRATDKSEAPSWEQSISLLLHENFSVSDRASQFFTGIVVNARKRRISTLDNIGAVLANLLSSIILMRYGRASSGSGDMEVDADDKALEMCTITVPLQCLLKLINSNITCSSAISVVLSVLSSVAEDSTPPNLRLITHHRSIASFLLRLLSLSKPYTFSNEDKDALTSYLSTINKCKRDACHRYGNDAEMVGIFAQIMVF